MTTLDPMNSLRVGTKTLVLGGQGFIGAHLVRALLDKGCSVRVFGRHQAPETPTSLRAEHVQGDFATGEGLDAALAEIEIVYHLISSTVPSTSNADPAADVATNLVGTLHLLQAMRAKGIKRIVYVSSGGTVYGNPSSLPVTENHPLHPMCSYGVVKVAVENYLQMYSALYGMRATVLRVSNPYGLHQEHIGVQGVIATFFKKISANALIEIWGDGSVVRDYIFIQDVISALIAAAEMDKPGIYNIGSGIGYSLNEILAMVGSVSGRKPNVIYTPKRNFDVAEIYLDVSKAESVLGWRPTVSLREGCMLYWNTLTNGINF
jgi:UDP-glucose 4-epimerase